MLKANYKGKFGCKRTKNVNACVCAHLPIDRVEQVVVTEQLSTKSKDSPCTSRTDSVCNDLNSLLCFQHSLIYPQSDQGQT